MKTLFHQKIEHVVVSYKKEYKVAASIRKNYSEYVKFDNK